MKERKRKERRCCWHYLVFFLWYICRMFCIIVDAINSPFGDRSFECTASEAGHEVPGVVVWPLLLHRGLGWEMLRDIRFDKATPQSGGK